MLNFLRVPKWTILRKRVLERDRYICQYCGGDKDLQVDHIWPRSKGGKDEMHNLVTACKSCNTSKGGKTLREWMEVRNTVTKHVLVASATNQPQTQTLRIVTQETNEKDKVVAEVNIPNLEKMTEFAAAVVIGGMPFSQFTAVETCAFFTRKEFNLLRDSMMKRGLLTWKNPNKPRIGYRLTDSGETFLRAIAVGEKLEAA